ncbi:hypothetical protein MASR2M18_01950 [Ignavibacteria bacterium]|nr:choice-of-anchor D domain-containing protein [Bacteroidota bacterium]MCZ2132583.1 choice-of-anchor D domain-containing protein [Bacteroidota bacterium]
MRMLRIISMLLLLSPFIATAQISGIDASGYPTIKAYGGGPIFNNAKTSDFNVIENGQSMNATLTVQCSTVVRDPSVSVVLVIDKSESMATPMGNGMQRLDWVKQGAKTFVQSLDFNKNTQVAVVSFDGDAYIECNFQSSPVPVLAAIDKITVSGGATRYDPPLLDPNKGAVALLKTTPPWIKRMIVFLTDGLPNSKPSQQTIINQLVAEKIILHALFITSEVSNELAVIAHDSGGETFRANTQDLINQFYRQLAEQVPDEVTYCWLSWVSPYVCSEALRNRAVQIIHRPTNFRQNFSYIAPPNSVAGIAISSQSLPPFPDGPPGSTSTQTYRITASNAPIMVTGSQITPSANFTISDWGGTPPPFPLAQNQSRTLTVTFTQTAPRDIRNAQIVILGSPCSSPPLKVASGASDVSVITPNGGEIYSSCDSVTVEWSGVDPSNQVVLHYNDNNSLLWKVLATNVAQMKYIWRKPPVISNGKVRVAALTPRTDYSQPAAVSGSGRDTVMSASVHSSGSLLYFAGSFDKNVAVGFPPNGKTGAVVISSPRNEEAFLAQSAFGKVRWAVSGATFLQPFAPFTLSRGIAVSINEQTGEALASGEIFRQTNGKHSVWVGQFGTNGSTRWIKEITSFADIHARRVGIDSSTGNIFVEGNYSGDFTLTLANGKNVYLTSATPKTYLLLLDNNGRAVHLQDNSYIKPSKPVRDSIGNLYEFGAFRTTLRNADTTLTTKGSADGYVRKYGRVLSPSDESNGVFSIVRPMISFKQNKYDAGASNIGISKDVTFDAMICNTQKVPATLRSVILRGNDSTDFTVIFPPMPFEIQPDSCMSVVLRMTPPRIGEISTQLFAEGECVSANTAVVGFGTQQEAQITNMHWGKKRMLTDNQGQIYLQNKGTTPLTVVSLALRNSPENNFIPIFRQTPYTLSAGAVDTIQTRFNPQDTLQYMNYVTASIAEMQQPVIGLLSGEGVLPQIQAKGYNFGSVEVGRTAAQTGKIYLHNPSLTSATAVKKVEIISNSGDFAIAVNTLQRFDIPESFMDSSVVSVRFSPIQRGRRVAVIKIYSDAAPGPDADPIVEDTVHVVGYGLQIGSLDAVALDFGDTPFCDKPIQNITINNPDASIDVKISRTEIIGADSAYFALLPADSIVPAGKTLVLPVQFLPDAERLYSAALHFYDEFNQEYTVLISGEGKSVIIHYDVEPKKIVYKPGDNVSLKITATTNASNAPEIAPINIKVTADRKMAASGKINSSSPAWNWSVFSDGDTSTYSGVPAGGAATMPSGEILTLGYSAFLGEKATAAITLQVTTDAPCIIPETNGSMLEIEQICFGAARFVHGGKQYFLGKVYPQPSNDEITIPIGVGLSGRVSVKIYDALGRTAIEAIDATISEGVYNFTVPTTALPSGIYTILYSAGQFTASSQLIISR